MRQRQIRFRVGLLCMLGLLADHALAQGDLSQMSYTGLTLTVVDGELGGGSGCSFYGSYVITPWGSPHGNEPTWSSDGAQIAFTDGADIFVTSPVRRLTSTNNNMNPAWAPDGRQIAFVSSRDGRLEIYSMSPDGSDVVRLTYGVASTVGRPAWSPDSRRIAFNCEVDVDNQDICAINRDGSGFTRLTANPATDADPAWSPDGTKMVFSTTRFDGITPLFALMNPDGSQVAQIGSGIGGSRAAWSPDGTRIAFSRYYSPDLTPDLPKSGIYTIAPNGTSESVLGASLSLRVVLRAMAMPKYSMGEPLIQRGCPESPLQSSDINARSSPVPSMDRARWVATRLSATTAGTSGMGKPAQEHRRPTHTQWRVHIRCGLQ